MSYPSVDRVPDRDPHEYAVEVFERYDYLAFSLFNLHYKGEAQGDDEREVEHFAGIRRGVQVLGDVLEGKEVADCDRTLIPHALEFAAIQYGTAKLSSGLLQPRKFFSELAEDAKRIDYIAREKGWEALERLEGRAPAEYLQRLNLAPPVLPPAPVVWVY